MPLQLWDAVMLIPKEKVWETFILSLARRLPPLRWEMNCVTLDEMTSESKSKNSKKFFVFGLDILFQIWYNNK